LLRALGFPLPAPQPRAGPVGTPRRPGPAVRGRLDQLQREHAFLPSDQGKPRRARVRLRRRGADRGAGRRRAFDAGDDRHDFDRNHDDGYVDDVFPEHAAYRRERDRSSVMAKKFDAKAKAKRQKIIAAVLGVVLLAALAYEVPSLLAVMNKKAPPPPVIAAPPPPG